MSENYINHIALVLDASGSMSRRAKEVVKVADAQISHLAQRSRELNQETRVTVYTFDSEVKCVIFDKDVLRLPSIASYYQIGGMTALIDATIKSQEDLAKTAQMYGDHAFLSFVLTDGAENHSKARAERLAALLHSLEENWTVACLVPDITGKHEAKRFGFPADNIAIWDVNSDQGVQEVGRVIREATETFMTNRSQGIRGSRSLFSTGPDAVNAATVKTTLVPLRPDLYEVWPVRTGDPLTIRDFVERYTGRTYRTGSTYYELSKTETIQAGKAIAVLERRSQKVYTGQNARGLLGLPDMSVRVKPDYNPDYTVFVQSTSVNRRLVPATEVLVMR